MDCVQEKYNTAGVKIINSTWVIEKKSNEKLKEWVSMKGLKDIEGKYYSGLLRSAPIRNDATIQIIMTFFCMVPHLVAKYCI